MTDQEFIAKYGSKLNTQQLEAVRATEGPVLLLAVPGSGKTTVLVNRLGYMLYVKGIDPSNILTLTYTVAATRDMAERFTALFGEDISDRLEFRTINGICAKIIAHYGRLIGKTSFELITDEKISGKLLTDIFVKIMKEYPTESDIKAVRTLITYCKNMMLEPKEIKELGENEGIELLDIYESYNRELKARSLMDYDDQMIYAYRMLKGSKDLLEFYRDKYRYICVDEAQDTSKVQHMIIALLSGEKGNLFMVGDEDQSIYGFRAAYPDALLHFEKEHRGAKVLIMDKNYRSNAKIVETADRFIQKNFSRHEKHMCATREAESDISFISLSTRESQYKYLLEMAKDVKTQTAVLYRDNESILPLVDLLLRENVPYRIKNADMAFFTHRVVVDAVNILKFCLNPSDPELFMRIYFKFQTFLRKPDAEAMCRIADDRHIGILDAAEYVDINKHVLGNVRALRTHFRNMASESTYKAINRMDRFMGYGDYLRDNNIDDNKLFILKMISKNEPTIEGFLERLEELRQILTDGEVNYKSKLILSTIHSSKGLEYDTVYLMDVINGVFPSKIIGFKSASPKEKRDYEEERRIFYVGITRAKDKLCIFKYGDEASIFVSEINPEQKPIKKEKVKRKKENVLRKPTPLLKKRPAVTSKDNVPDSLIIGERISSPRYGEGTITDVVWDDDEIPMKFTVEFDSGNERIFMYPFAFTTGMKVIE
ncbi:MULTISPECIES: ATP-dependent helicase [unclassified Butyrivibrio]|uniref:ATP-dependent helicase n=1 Tax=unclassified Butyrivibrio TaxID=2639466 RepID=UPI000419D249|nr:MULTISPECIES: ATP-dependent helicase [unclassified Butyrivibrio]